MPTTVLILVEPKFEQYIATATAVSEVFVANHPMFADFQSQ